MGRSYECILDVFFTSTLTVSINFTAQYASVITKPGNRTINQLESGMSNGKKHIIILFYLDCLRP
jgi:hypothetical protein